MQSIPDQTMYLQSVGSLAAGSGYSKANVSDVRVVKGTQFIQRILLLQQHLLQQLQYKTTYTKY